jgi:hypothetical protein
VESQSDRATARPAPPMPSGQNGAESVGIDKQPRHANDKAAPHLHRIFAATSKRGSQIIASTADGARLLIDCDETLTRRNACRAAAEALCKQYGWSADELFGVEVRSDLSFRLKVVF